MTSIDLVRFRTITLVIVPPRLAVLTGVVETLPVCQKVSHLLGGIV